MPKGRKNARRDPKTGKFLKLKADDDSADGGNAANQDHRTGTVKPGRGRPKKEKPVKPADTSPPVSQDDDSDDHPLDMFGGGLEIEL